MDIYGYPPYQYNESDELAKQMFAQQALGASEPYSRGMQAPHIMPVPSGVPWNVQGIPWGSSSPPQLVQFTGQVPLQHQITPVIHCKRKSLEVEPVIPPKQLITEEKMAAHLNSLHISSQYTPHTLAEDEVMDMGIEPVTTDVSEKLKGHTIVLSEELKRITEQPLLPAALIERMEKPHMSLVVWKPRDNILGLEKSQEDKEKNSQQEEEKPKKRNGVLVAEHSGMDVEM